MKSILVAIAKDEDNYIDEWLEYNLKLGFDNILVFQNDWRYSGKYLENSQVIFKELDGLKKQNPAYNDFIDSDFSNQFDFAAFFDVDEFLFINDNIKINTFLEKYVDYDSIFVNWRIFGDNGLEKVIDNNFSIKRFTKCGESLHSLGKHIVNLKKIKKTKHRFIHPHFIGFIEKEKNSCKIFKAEAISPSLTTTIKSGRHIFRKDHVEPAELYHFRNKTFEERYNRCFKKQDVLVGNDNKITNDINLFKKDFDEYNKNEIDNFNIINIITKSH